MMRSLALAGVLAVVPAAFAAAPPASVAGTWTTQTEVQGIAVNETCKLAQAADGALSGTCETGVGIYKITGKVNDTSVNFSHPAAYQGEDMTVSFFGKFDAPTDTISGSIDMQSINAGGAFAMKRVSK
jgi:hypothetical protein